MARTQITGAQIRDATVDLTADTTGTLPVANGGTGNATNTLNNALLGNGTGALQAVAPSTAGNVLRSDGTTWASTALVKGDVGLGNVDNTSNATERAATATLTNKRITARIGTTASSSTPTPDADANDQYNVTALAANATFGAPTGTPTDGQRLTIRIKDNGTARTLAWNAIYRAIGIALPTTTVISKTMYMGMVFNSADTKWDVLATGTEA